MARSRKSHTDDKEETKSRRGPPSYPYVVYASWAPEGPESMRWLILKFQTPMGARNMIESLKKNLWGGSYELKTTASMNWHYMQFENGMKISLRDNEQYTEVMGIDYDPSISYVPVEVQQFKYGSSFESHKAAGSRHYDGDDETESDRKESARANRRSSKRSVGAKNPSDRKERKVLSERPKRDRTGLISANDIATELGVLGRDVRGVLRQLKMVKPEGGWLFTKDEAETIRKQVKENLKKKKK